MTSQFRIHEQKKQQLSGEGVQVFTGTFIEMETRTFVIIGKGGILYSEYKC